MGIEPSSPLKTRKLFIPLSDKSYQIDTNAEVGYTVGTRTDSPRFLENAHMSGISVSVTNLPFCDKQTGTGTPILELGE